MPFWRGQVDGVVLCTGSDGPIDKVIGWVSRGGVPAISVRNDLLDPRLPAVFIDPESIGRLAIDHRLSLAASFSAPGQRLVQGLTTPRRSDGPGCGVTGPRHGRRWAEGIDFRRHRRRG